VPAHAALVGRAFAIDAVVHATKARVFAANTIDVSIAAGGNGRGRCDAMRRAGRGAVCGAEQRSVGVGARSALRTSDLRRPV